MGFYNIYKILKDMLRTVFGKNILKILIIIILFFIILTIKQKCFGVVIDTTPLIGHSIDVDLSQYDNKKYTLCMSKTSNNQIQINVGFSSQNSCTIYPQNYSYSKYYISPFNKTVGGADGYTTDTALINRILSAMSQANGNYTGTPAYRFDIPNFTINPVYYTNNMTIYNPDGSIHYTPFTPPTLSNTQTQLENLSYTNFIVNANSFTNELKNNDGLLYMQFYNKTLDSNSTFPIQTKIFVDGSIFVDENLSTDDNLVFSYPLFMSGVFFNIGSTYEIKFAHPIGWESDNETPILEYFDTSYTFTISSNVTQDYINQINQQTATTTDDERNKELNNNINKQTEAIENQTQAIENQTQSIDNINNSITDSTVDNSSIDLPTDSTSDPTQSGVDNIFQTIYNSFTSGTAQDIVLPIPFTNKNITIEADYLYNALQNNNANWIINIIQAFYWYIIILIQF